MNKHTKVSSFHFVFLHLGGYLIQSLETILNVRKCAQASGLHVVVHAWVVIIFLGPARTNKLGIVR